MVFDVLQLNAQFAQAVGPFLEGGHSKLVYDAATSARVCAQQFGLNLANIFHAQSAFQMLVNRQPDDVHELLQFCDMQEAEKMKGLSKMLDRAPELWTHRPLQQDTLKFAVERSCLLLDCGHKLFKKLEGVLGAATHEKVFAASAQCVQQGASHGWELRNSGFTGERHDPELVNWLARRFGQEPGPSDANKDLVTEKIIRAGDSPRTASWRATVAMVNVRARSVGRERSDSPSLENWIAKRNNVKQDAPRAPAPREHRASSLPPRSSSTFISEPATSAPNPHSSAAEPFWLQGQQQHKAWVEMMEEEQARKADEQDLFNALNKVDEHRMAQAERS
eukprot:SRR837773.20192.p3 GENE.SRR837773.20192~~SRR837773.20192.p3  ORF type:complete len:335 (+),score=128.64 SRR837773.20192:468-1472(+)